MSSVVTMSVSEAVSELLNNIEAALDDVQFHQDNQDYDGQFREAFKYLHKDQSNILETQLKNVFDSESGDKIKKNREISVELREKGNKYFQSDKFLEALECYNRSVILAPSPENIGEGDCKYEDFAICLTNR